MANGYTTVTATHLCDATGNPVANATIYFRPVSNNGTPISFRVGATAEGQTCSESVSALVTAGAFTVTLADTTLTSPINVGYACTLVDNLTGQQLLSAGYGCVQPSGDTWSFDAFEPNLAAQITMQYGPVGPEGQQGVQGQPGSPANPRGSFDPTATYSKSDLVSLNGSSYLSLLDGNHGITPSIASASAPTVLGTSGGTVNTPTSPNVAIMLPGTLAAGILTSFSATISSHSAGGLLNVVLLTANSDGTFTAFETFAVTPTGTGLHIFAAGADFTAVNVPSGTHVAYWSATELVGFDITTSSPGYAYITSVPPTTQTWTVMTGGRVDLAVTVSPAWMVIAAAGANEVVTPVDEAYLVSGGRTLLDHNAYVSFPAGWSNPGGFTIANGGGLLSPTTGTAYAVGAYSNNVITCERRTYRSVFEFVEAGVFAIGSGQFSVEDTSFGTSILVDSAAATLTIENAVGANNAANSGAAQSVPLGFAPALNTPYTLSILMNRREMTVSVTDSVTGLVATLTVGSNATSTGYYQSEGAAPGLMLDQLCYRSVSGQYKVLADWTYADVKRPRAYIVGDSITQGFGLALTQRWSQQVADATGNATISGRSGCNSGLVVQKLGSELQYLRPDYMVVMIGTNDLAPGNIGLAALQANYNTIITTATAQGVKVIACALPPAQQIGSQADVNTLNAWLLARTDLAGVIRMDRALTVNNDGVTQNTSLFISGNTHPNASGSALMFARAQADVPFLFDATVISHQQIVMGASGAGHQPGAVPDAGSTAGASRFLREDATWVVPASGSGSASPATASSLGTVQLATGQTTTTLAKVATSGVYTDLTGTPTIPNMAAPGAIGGTTAASGTFAGITSVGADTTVHLTQNAGTNGYFGIYDIGGDNSILQFSANRRPIDGYVPNPSQGTAFINVEVGAGGSSTIQFVTAGAVSTGHTILDDGAGNATFASIILPDTTNGHTYKLQMVNGLLTPTQIS